MTPTHRRLKQLAALLLLSCLCSSHLFAQKKSSRFSASLTGGVSVPTGRFADKERVLATGLPDVDGGAETGWNGNLQLGAAITPKIWLTLTAGHAQFKRDDAAFEEILGMMYGYASDANAGSWKVFKLMAGPSFRLPIGEKLSFRPAISAGIAKTSIPVFNWTTYNQGGNPLSMGTQSKTKMPAAFAYQGSAAIGYKLNPRLSILADFTYFASEAKYKYPSTNLPPTWPETPEYHYELNSVSFSAGVEFSF